MLALMNLLRLGTLLDRKDLLSRAEKTMKAFAGSVERSAFGFDRFLAGVDFYHSPRKEIVVVGPRTNPATQALIRAVDEVYDANKVVMLFDPASENAAALQEKMPLLAGKLLVDGKPAVYVCRNHVCRRPVTTAEELRRELQAN